MATTASDWEPVARTEDRSRGRVADYLHFAAQHKAWWLVPALIVFALLTTLVLLARGSILIPDIYVLF